MKAIIQTIVVIGILVTVIIATADRGIETKEGNAVVLCDIAFMYDLTKPHSVKTVEELEQLAQQCKGAPRKTNHYYHTSGKWQGENKHAVVAGDMCTVNWELTPKAHLEAYNNVCVN